jgi:hypothetical protein
MLLNNYQANIVTVIQKYVNEGWILSFSFSVDSRSNYVGFIQGNLEFLQGSRLSYKSLNPVNPDMATPRYAIRQKLCWVSLRQPNLRNV